MRLHRPGESDRKHFAAKMQKHIAGLLLIAFIIFYNATYEAQINSKIQIFSWLFYDMLG